MTSSRFRLAVPGLALLLLLPVAALAQTASDTTFADANWTLTVFPAGNGGSVVANQQTVGGNSFRSVADTVGASLSTILGTHIYNATTYNPAVSGAIGSLNYSEDAFCQSGCFGQGQSTGPAVLQGGTLYIYNGFLITGPGATTQTLTLSGLTANDFGRVAVTTTTLFDTTHPDFSAAGGPIQFGFFRANGSGPSPGYTLTAGIDNWSVQVVAGAAAAPVPTLNPLAMSALALMLAVAAVLFLRRS
ncbi:MAG: hypothetical protein ABI682_05955 [Acidobacteriota bacterium]